MSYRGIWEAEAARPCLASEQNLQIPQSIQEMVRRVKQQTEVRNGQTLFLGGRLILCVCSAAWQYTVHEVRLHVVTKNEAALRLYEKHGFKKGVLKKQYPQQATDAWQKVFAFYENLGKWFLHFSEPESLGKAILPKANRNLALTRFSLRSMRS